MDIRKQNARYALSLVEDGSVIGLGGGQTIRLLASLLSEKEDISIVTPSSETALICQSAGLKVLPSWLVSSIDIAFDSCDEIDENFIALKSGGGIHTQEKIIGSMAKRYVLLVDLNKYQPRLTYQHPVVLEIVKSSYALVCSQLEKMGLSYHYRKAPNKDGLLLSDSGNILVDVEIETYQDPCSLYHSLKSIVGVIEISLFVKEVTDIVYMDNEKIVHKTKEKQE
ncbi:MAG TPA: ribose 5-phosphate isomerase A [Candidatus Faecalicoccus intestinipullorum]|nr:ribose 5-phosphate isomerase A [Candidatus Faecalicoccus intestinipullorum]